MMHNRAAVMYGMHDVRLEDKPLPEPGPKDVLVEIKAVGVCGSDVHYYEEGRIGSFVVEEPLILGHESMGTVVALGDEATEHEVADRVTLEPGVPDMTCRECRAGCYNLCPNFQELRNGEVRRMHLPRTRVNSPCATLC
jgi:L-iditol 2-dehydrogenase